MTWTTRILNSFSSYCDPVKQYWGLLVNDNITDEQTCSCYPDVLWVLHIKVRIKSCNSAKKKFLTKTKNKKPANQNLNPLIFTSPAPQSSHVLCDNTPLRLKSSSFLDWSPYSYKNPKIPTICWWRAIISALKSQI